MARPRAFDEDTVLTAAMHAFRRSGYAGLSVSQLETATGLRASSIYNAYGDKAGLYQRALDHYVASFVAARLEAHAGPGASLEDLEVVFTSLFEPPLTDGYGCLVTNSATELGSASIASDGVRRAIELVDRHCADVLRREVGSDADAARLVLLYQGLLVLIRAGLASDHHLRAIHQEFARLRDLRTDREDTP